MIRQIMAKTNGTTECLSYYSCRWKWKYSCWLSIADRRYQLTSRLRHLWFCRCDRELQELQHSNMTSLLLKSIRIDSNGLIYDTSLGITKPFIPASLRKKDSPRILWHFSFGCMDHPTNTLQTFCVVCMHKDIALLPKIPVGVTHLSPLTKLSILSYHDWPVFWLAKSQSYPRLASRNYGERFLRQFQRS